MDMYSTDGQKFGAFFATSDEQKAFSSKNPLVGATENQAMTLK